MTTQSNNTGKEVLNITPGIWHHSVTFHQLRSKDNGSLYNIAAFDNQNDFTQDNLKAICNAINGTYGKGIDPAGVEDLFSSAWNALQTLEGINNLSPKLLKGSRTMSALKTALQNIKLPRP